VKIFDRIIFGLLRLFPLAFSATNMNRLHAGTVTLWIYKTTDAFVGTVDQSGYFSAYVNELRENDVIIAICATGGTQTIDLLVVSSADNATPVTVINGT